MKAFRALSALLMIAMLLGACAPVATPPPAQPAATEAPAAVAPAATQAPAATEAPVATEAPAATEAPTAQPAGEEKVLRMINTESPTILNVHLSFSNADSEAARLITEPLAAYDENGEAVPILAEEIPTLENGGISKDLMTTTWKLRKGVKWSDGTDFTADDVIFTWQYIMNPEVASVSVASYSGIENIEALDPTTVKITWKTPNSEPLIAFGALYGGVLQKKQFEPYNNETANQSPANLAPIGTGPFMVVDAKPGDTYVYVKNPLYRNADKVYFDRVILKAGGDATSAARAVVQTGEYDYSYNMALEKDVLESLNSTGTMGQIYSKITSQTLRIALNHTNPDPSLGDQRSNFGTEHPFLKDLAVRQALSLAIDRGALVDQFLGPMGLVTCNWANPPYLTMQATKWPDCSQDMEKAKALLDGAGWVDHNGDGVRDKDGVEIKILFLTYVNPVMQKYQEAIKAYWEELGVAVELKAAPPSVMFSGDRSNPDSTFNFFADASMFAWGGVGTSTTARYLANMLCSSIPQSSNQWAGSNIERWCYPEYDQCYAEFLVEADPVKHDQLGSKCQDMWVNDVAGIALAQRTITNAVSNKLKGVRTSSRDLEGWAIAEWYMEP